MADIDLSGLSAAVHRRENPIEHLSNDDIRAVAYALKNAAQTQLALWRLAVDAQQVSDTEPYLLAMQELARSTFRRVDASLGRLTGDSLGDFDTEFDNE